ncbi:hypothetical protein EDC01DRAFT_89237 [Geopyxis carbonaria]|nr:hypothetical protein EDC01DRAFT_89237 [Geopyxis carbonaria]
MATIARPSHAREPSVTTLESDVNPHFSFPPQAHERSQSTSFQFPPLQYSSNENYTFPPRRGSVPINLAEAGSRPRSGNSDALKQLTRNSSAIATRETNLPSPESPEYTSSSPRSGGPPSPYYTGARSTGRTIGDGVSPTVLNASVRLGPVPTKASFHSREASELLKVPPMLDPKPDEKDPVLSPANKVVPPPPNGVNSRRGHAHRRSGAISSSDVWSLMNQSAPALPVSGDASKNSTGEGAGSPARISPGPSPRLSWSAPVSPGIACEPPMPSPELEAQSDTAATLAERRNTRVSFIEKVEIIPRPLSSGTETSTIRGHAGADSISSSIASPLLTIDTTVRIPSPTRRPHNRTRSNSQTLALPTAALRAQSDRPSTAGAILTSPVVGPKEEKVDKFPDIPSLKRPATASPCLNGSAETSPVRKTSAKRAHKKSQSDFSPLVGPSEFDAPSKSEPTSNSSSPSTGKKKKKNKKKVKNWAGNILGKGKLKNSKRHHKSPKRSPTPPLTGPENAAPGEYEWVATSWNESYVMLPVDTSPNLDAPKVAVSGGPDSPVIDLDAALGPFKTPVAGSSAANLAAARRRRMHSSGGRGSTAYFHRRSESMPEMQLFALEEDEDRTMEDVFEEEEEESSEESSDDSSSDEDEGQIGGGDGLGIGIASDDGIQQWSPEASSSESDLSDVSNKRLSVATIKTDVTTTPVLTELPPSPRRKGVPADIITPLTSPQSSASTVTTSSINHSFNMPLDSPSTFHTASSTLNTPIQPDFPEDDSSGSFNPYQDYLGEPGPEMRMSVDDIPSLTSSSSTMTMSAAYLGMPSTPSTNEMMLGSGSIGGGKEKKEKSKRWSRVWGFWRSK